MVTINEKPKVEFAKNQLQQNHRLII